MPVFHAPARHATNGSVRQSLQRLGAALCKLSERGLSGEDFECFEREVHALFVEAEREVLATELESLDVDLPYVTIAGRRHNRVLRSSETYTSAVGPVTMTRTLYRSGKGKSVVLLELRAGMMEGRQWTGQQGSRRSTP